MWKIFYEGGDTFVGHTYEDAKQAPREGFLLAVGYDDTDRRYIMQGWNFYRYDKESNQFWGHDLFGLLDWAIKSRRILEYKLGPTTMFKDREGDWYDLTGIIYLLKNNGEIFEARTVTNKVWGEVVSKASRDPDFPVRKL